jgi:hypothetical protein
MNHTAQKKVHAIQHFGPSPMTLAIANPASWLVEINQVEIPSLVACASAFRWSLIVGWPDGIVNTSMSRKPIPSPKPVPSAFMTASFAANRPESLAIRSNPIPALACSSSVKHLLRWCEPGAFNSRSVDAISTRSMPWTMTTP